MEGQGFTYLWIFKIKKNNKNNISKSNMQKFHPSSCNPVFIFYNKNVILYYKMINEPVNKTLYMKIKKEVYKKYPKHSAYRSGLLVKKYKEAGGTYKGVKTEEGLTRWFKEHWRNQKGETGYKKKGDVYRPTKRITKDTPKTFKELSKKDIEKAQKEKEKTGRAKFTTKK